MLTVYMDESGFTGEDLLNTAQPFVHVSTTLDDGEALQICNEYFRGFQGPELKHKTLSRRPNGRARVQNFIADMRATGKFTSWICHKEFAALTYLVDLWVEPAMHQDGIDLYKDGANLALCNMAYYCLQAYQGDRFLREHLRRFQRMMIQRSAATYAAFWRELHKDYERVDQLIKDILVFFLGAQLKFGPSRLNSIPKRALDPALATVVQTCTHWRERNVQSIKLVHDKSSNLSKDKWLWDLLSSSEIEPKGFSIPGRSIHFPFNVSDTEFSDSRIHRQLQLCDVIAGATAAWGRQFISEPRVGDYESELGRAGIEDFQIGAIWPRPQFDPDATGMRGWSREMVEFLSQQLEKADKRPS